MNNVRLNVHLAKADVVRIEISREQEYGTHELSSPDVAPKAPEDRAYE
jgi:hypothetical protein